jgi:beta-alanine degradation protein BauB
MIIPPGHWPQWRQEELARNQMNGRVGSRLELENEDVRVWTIALQPGERLGFHRHVLNYFWTAVTDGHTRTISHDGKVADGEVKANETKHHRIGKGEFLLHDLENIGSDVLRFVTVELKTGSANAPVVI